MENSAMKRPAGRSTLSRMEIGRIGEASARRHLEQHGWTIVESNWRCRLGEIDLIARPPAPGEETLVFIEVRTRRAASPFGTAEESVNVHKQRKVRSVAQCYLSSHGGSERHIRFDVIAVTLDWQQQVIALNWIEGAF
jgi:putative endonuclease